jgi:flavin-dependent dehydrogenase
VDADLLIAGGGPAGLATAIFAARRGLRALVFDRRELPLDKACGEGLMPPGLALLREMGIEAQGRPFVGIRFVDQDSAVEGRFRSGAGISVRRTELISALVARARAVGADLAYGAGVETFRELPDRIEVTTAIGVRTARFLIGADGLHSRIRRDAGLERPIHRARPRYGIRRTFKLAPWTEYVDVLYADQCEAYITPLLADQVGVTFLGGAAGFDAHLSRFPTLIERLRGAEQLGAQRGAGPLEQAARARVKGRIALVGDAAGYLDAITGEGLSTAFRSARALAETIASGGPLSAYEREYRRATRAYYLTTSLLLAVAARPPWRKRLFELLAAERELFEQLLSITMGDLPIRALGWRSALRLVARTTMPPLF